MNDITLTEAEAEAMLPPGPVIHTLTRLPGGDSLGEDWPREQVLRLLRDATMIRPAGELSRAMGHGLAVLSPWRSASRTTPDITFIETERRDQLHYAIGTYAEHLAGIDDEAAAAAARVPAGQMDDYNEITSRLRADHADRTAHDQQT